MSYAANLILVHSAELVLKGHNRAQFETRLQRQITARLQRLGLAWPVERVAGRMAIRIGEEDGRLAEALGVLGEIPGIAAYFPAMSFDPSDAAALETGPLAAALLDLARRLHRPGARFAVRVERHDPDSTASTQALERIW
ncbi:MAG: hypothetical protein ACRESG_06995, partial [Gammaproteobacteria bacterium]